MDQVKSPPKTGQVYRHHKGDAYEILDILNTLDGGSEKFPVMVAYRNLGSGEKFCRPLAQFMEKFTYVREPNPSPTFVQSLLRLEPRWKIHQYYHGDRPIWRGEGGSWQNQQPVRTLDLYTREQLSMAYDQVQASRRQSGALHEIARDASRSLIGLREGNGGTIQLQARMQVVVTAALVKVLSFAG